MVSLQVRGWTHARLTCLLQHDSYNCGIWAVWLSEQWQTYHAQDTISNFNTWVQQHYTQLPHSDGNRGDYLRSQYLIATSAEPEPGPLPAKDTDGTDPERTTPTKSKQLPLPKRELHLNPSHSKEVPNHDHRRKAQKRQAAHSREKARKAQRARDEMKEPCQPWQTPLKTKVKPQTRPSLLPRKGGQGLCSTPAPTPDCKHQECSMTAEKGALEHVHHKNSTGPSKAQAQAESTASQRLLPEHRDMNSVDPQRKSLSILN